MRHTHFLILETGLPVTSLRRHGGFDHWIRTSAGLPRQAVVTCRVSSGESLPPLTGWTGVLVTGSSAMVSDRADWSERSADWLRRAHEQGVPLLGICYGHQLIAHALGGQVDYHPRGREMGTVRVELQPAASSDPLFSNLPSAFAAQTSHLQTVLQPPAGAVVLARTAHDQCKAFRVGASTWGLQFHPEFSTRHIRGYIRARHADLRAEGFDPAHMEAAVAPTPHSRRLLSRFVHWARHSHHD